MGDSLEKGDQIAELDKSSSAKTDGEVPSEKQTSARVPSRLQPPAFLANMSKEERLALETKLKRKIDLRLMPAIIVMYILNYIDR